MQRAHELWLQGEFWEVHEELEPGWMHSSGETRHFLQTLILIAAALHKSKSSETGGFRNLAKAQTHAAQVVSPELREIAEKMASSAKIALEAKDLSLALWLA